MVRSPDRMAKRPRRSVNEAVDDAENTRSIEGASSDKLGEDVTIKMSDIPHYLHNSAFYLSLCSEDNDGCDIQIPKQCFKINEEIIDMDDVELLLRVMQFWGLDIIPTTLIQFCDEQDIVTWNEPMKDIIGCESKIYSDLTSVFEDQSDCLLLSIATGRCEIVEYLAAFGPSPMDTTAPSLVSMQACIEGRLDVLKILHKYEYPWDPDCCTAAAGLGHLDCLRFAHEKKCPWNERVTNKAAAAGQTQCLRYALENGCDIHADACNGACRGDHLECLKLLHEFNAPWSPDAPAWAAGSGALSCLAYCIENNCPIDDNLIQQASLHGRIDCLRYALTNNIPCSNKEALCRVACCNGALACAQLLLENGASLRVDYCRGAAENGQLACLQYLHSLNCPWDESVTCAAAKVGQLDCLKYLHAHNCPWNVESMLAAVSNGHIDTIFFLSENGCPLQEPGVIYN